MKARSFVFTHLQWPATVFGLPPRLAVGAVGVALLAYTTCVAFRLPALMMPAAIITGAVGLSWVYVLGKRDRHVETLFLTSAKFWRSSPCRRLLAGTPSPRSRGGRR